MNFLPGDNIYFKKGETWREQLTVPSSGSAGNPITFGAYGTGNNPIISGADSDDKVTGWSGPDGNGEYSKAYATQPKVVIADGTMLTAGTLGSLAATEWVYSGGKLYLGQDPSTYSTLEVGQRNQSILVSGRSYVTLSDFTLSGSNQNGSLRINTDSTYIEFNNSTVSKVFEVGILIEGSDYITIDSNTVEYIRKVSDGFGIALRSESGDVSDPDTHITISNNTVTTGLSAHGIYGSVVTDSTISGNTAYRIRFEPAASGTIDNIVIDGNTVTGRIGFGKDADATKTASNVTISNNTITGTEEHDESSLETSYLTGTNYFYGNTIVEPHTDHAAMALSDYGAGGVYYVYDNLITTANRGIANNGGGTMHVYRNKVTATGVVSSSADVGFSVANTAGTTVNLYNNIFNGFYYGIVLNNASTVANIYNNNVKFTSIGLYTYGVALTATVKNNIFYSDSASFYVYQIAGSTLVADYNIYGTATGNNWRSSGVTKSWANWQLVPQDAAGLNADPLFVDVAGGDFSLQSTSPAIDAGVSLGSAYTNGLDPTSTWPSNVLVLDQDLHGSAWEIGAYVYSNPMTHGAAAARQSFDEWWQEYVQELERQSAAGAASGAQDSSSSSSSSANEPSSVIAPVDVPSPLPLVAPLSPAASSSPLSTSELSPSFQRVMGRLQERINRRLQDHPELKSFFDRVLERAVRRLERAAALERTR